MQYGFLKDRHKDFPPILHVENTNICNIKCIHCPQADPYNLLEDYQPQSMSLDVFEKIVKEVAQYNTALRMTPDGETLLPKEFKQMLKMIVKEQVYLFAFNTNGLLMEGEILELLLNPGNTMFAVEISLDALQKDSYQAIRKGSDYERVMKNIFTLLYERKKRKLENKLKIMVSAINQPELPTGEFDNFIRFWEPVVDKVIRRTYVDTKAIMPQKQAPNVKDNELNSNVSPENDEKRWPCLVPFTRLVVTYDGAVRFCPDDWRKETTVSSIYEKSLAEIWQSDEMNNLRQSHLENSIEHPTCLYCTDWQAIKWGYDYIKALNDLFGDDVL